MKSTRSSFGQTLRGRHPSRLRKWLSANTRASLSIPGQVRRPWRAGCVGWEFAWGIWRAAGNRAGLGGGESEELQGTRRAAGRSQRLRGVGGAAGDGVLLEAQNPASGFPLLCSLNREVKKEVFVKPASGAHALSTRGSQPRAGQSESGEVQTLIGRGRPGALDRNLEPAV